VHHRCAAVLSILSRAARACVLRVARCCRSQTLRSRLTVKFDDDEDPDLEDGTLLEHKVQRQHCLPIPPPDGTRGL
jgi:hypothetical protein